MHLDRRHASDPRSYAQVAEQARERRHDTPRPRRRRRRAAPRPRASRSAVASTHASSRRRVNGCVLDELDVGRARPARPSYRACEHRVRERRPARGRIRAPRPLTVDGGDELDSRRRRSHAGGQLTAPPTHSSIDSRDSVITASAGNVSPNTVSANASIAPGSPPSPSVAEVATGVIRAERPLAARAVRLQRQPEAAQQHRHVGALRAVVRVELVEYEVLQASRALCAQIFASAARSSIWSSIL